MQGWQENPQREMHWKSKIVMQKLWLLIKTWLVALASSLNSQTLFGSFPRSLPKETTSFREWAREPGHEPKSGWEFRLFSFPLVSIFCAWLAVFVHRPEIGIREALCHVTSTKPLLPTKSIVTYFITLFTGDSLSELLFSCVQLAQFILRSHHAYITYTRSVHAPKTLKHLITQV